MASPLALGAALLAFACSAERSDAPDPSAPEMPRLLIIGLDGADLRWVDDLAVAGRLPHLAGLLERGVSSRLATIHHKSPIIWTTIATGVRPERHGIGDYLNFKNPVRTTLRRRPAFWNVLTHYGQSVGVLAWWATYPAEQVDGFMVSPYMLFRAPREPGGPHHEFLWSDDDPHRTWPPELAAEIAPSMLEAGEIDRDALSALFGEGRRTRVTPWVVARDLSYLAAARLLLETQPVETFVVYFQGIDVASHDLERWVFGPKENRARPPIVGPEEVDAAFERVRAMYAFVDGMIGRLLEHAGDDTDVVILSDHGWEYDGTGHLNLNPGVFIAAGPSFRQGRVEGVSVLDVAPILLASRGVPLSLAFEGKLPPGVLVEDVVARVRRVRDYPIPATSVPEVVQGEPDPSEEDSRMLELLQDLGYVE